MQLLWRKCLWCSQSKIHPYNDKVLWAVWFKRVVQVMQDKLRANV